MDEFDVIRRYFAPLATSPGAAGLTDDVAEVSLGSDERLIATADTIVEGVHFLSTDPLEAVARKLVRVNVSDILAKGGRPRAALLMLSWPRRRPLADIAGFARGLGEDCAHWEMALVGGDTTSTDGPLVASLTLLGACTSRGPVRRAGAQAGDDLWVTGVIGDGWLGLQAATGRLGGVLDDNELEALVDVYRTPEPPPLALASIIADWAVAAVDVSDGLAADAGRLASASNVGIEIDAPRVPLGPEARRWLAAAQGAELSALVTGGDDYQTLFAAKPGVRARLDEVGRKAGVALTRIGRVVEGDGVRVLDAAGVSFALPKTGYLHFDDQPD